jgi:hypothetical protein
MIMMNVNSPNYAPAWREKHRVFPHNSRVAGDKTPGVLAPKKNPGQNTKPIHKNLEKTPGHWRNFVHFVPKLPCRIQSSKMPGSTTSARKSDWLKSAYCQMHTAMARINRATDNRFRTGHRAESEANMIRQTTGLITAVSATLLCTSLGVMALLISGCDEIDQMEDNASKRPPVQSLMPPQIETDPEAREHKPATPPAATNPPATAAAPATDPNATPATQPTQPQSNQPQPDQAQQNQAQPVQPQPAAQQGPPEPETLHGNMGVQGQGYGGGIITEPVHQYFGMRQQITWDQIKHDGDIWQALHNRWPKDAKEFKKEILDPAGIELPELPKGRHYVYDPKTGELLVGWDNNK